jgi:SagB-type dehydrogenase family enzyme
LFLDKEVEGTIAIAPILDLQDEELIGRGQESREPMQRSRNMSRGIMTALPSATVISYPKLPDGQLLEYLHQSTQITEKPNMQKLLEKLDDKNSDTVEKNPVQDLDKYNFPFCTKVSTTTESIHWGADLEMLENTILQRRSTREYSGAKLELAELKAILDFTYQPQHYTDQGIDGNPDYFDLSLIETFVAVTGVVGLDEGCYYYAPKSQELRQIRFKNFRDELHYLCLGQDLGRDAGAVIFHTADLQKAVTKYGDRVYRYLHMDAGHLGQRINLAAIGLGVGVSGIAGFFDDLVNEVLGIPSDEAVLYITTLGRPR